MEKMCDQEKLDRPLDRPADKYSSGNNDYQCWAKIYGKTKKEANAKRKEYFASYPTRGYNTITEWEGWVISKEKRYYFIRMSRWHSCD